MYNGFQIKCNCHCAKCGSETVLEGYSDAFGVHYCAKCDDYVRVTSLQCPAQREDKIKARQETILKYNALND